MGSINFSAEKEALVKESWEILKPNALQHGLEIFSIVGQMLPEAVGMFYFLKDPTVLPQDNPKLKSHVVKVFSMICESATQLREQGKVVAIGGTLKNLAKVHIKKGVQDSHFDVVKVAFLRVIKEGVGEKWSEEMNVAWGEAYDHLAAAIIAEMKIQAN